MVNLNDLQKVATELGEGMTPEDLKDLLSRAASNGASITRDDFYLIMTKKAFP